MRSYFTSKPGFAILVVWCCFFAAISTANAQAYLSVQGVLTKTDGTAVDDGTYNLKFVLWKTSSGTSASDKAWEETVQDVETIGGVYSVVLGNNGTAITAPFDQVYYLGVSIGNGQELTPRPLLTHSPYALSLIGQTNLFPSTGKVKADWITAKSGGPNTGGYSFQSGGDTDGGLFSTADGNVSMYADGTERFKVSSALAGAKVSGKLTVTDTCKLEEKVNISDHLSVQGDIYLNEGSKFLFKNGTTESTSGSGLVKYYEGCALVSQGTGRVFVTNAGVYMSGIGFHDYDNMQYNHNTGEVAYDDSSRRHKENITDLEDDFSLILKAQPKTYTRPGMPDRWELGYIGEEMDSIGLKKLVNYESDGSVSNFNYEKMILYVTEVLKIQDAAIKELKGQNAAFQAEITALKSAGSSTGSTNQNPQQTDMEHKLDDMAKRLQVLEAALNKR